MIVVMGPLAGRLTDRVGPRPLMVLGLLIVAAALVIGSRITLHTGYRLLLPGFVLMGTGIGLVMSPMSTAAMNAVDRTKAGAASGVLSMSRMVGGSVGLSVMGALVTTIGRSKLHSTLPQVPAAARGKIASALGGSTVPSGRHVPPHVVHAVHSAFVSALGTGLMIDAAVTLAGALLAGLLIKGAPTRGQQSVDDWLAGEKQAPEAAAA